MSLAEFGFDAGAIQQNGRCDRRSCQRLKRELNVYYYSLTMANLKLQHGTSRFANARCLLDVKKRSDSKFLSNRRRVF